MIAKTDEIYPVSSAFGHFFNQKSLFQPEMHFFNLFNIGKYMS